MRGKGWKHIGALAACVLAILSVSLTAYAETGAAVDADINTSLEQIKVQTAAVYGVEFSFRKDCDAYSNYQFVQSVLNNFAQYPEGCVPIIANASKRRTGKTMKFRQRFPEDELVILDGSFSTGTYDYKSNLVETDCEAQITAHEMAHSMEAVLNSASGGALRTTFAQLNGGVAYSKYYYYDGDEQLSNNVPDCFVSGYSAISFSEDFADTFAQALIYDNAELENDLQKGYCSNALYQKIVYVKQLFNQYAGAAILN